MTDSAHPSLPYSWVSASLSELAQLNPGLDRSEITDDLDVTFVPMPAVAPETGKVDTSATRKFGNVKKGYTPFAQGDVLFAKITPCMENGKMAIVPALINGLGFGSTEFHVLRPREGIDARYIYYFVSGQRFRREAEHNMTGAVGQRRVPTNYLAKCLVPLPPSAEQLRIVNKIEELLSELDDGVDSLVAAYERVQLFRQALLRDAFMGRLTADWRTKNRLALRSAKHLKDELLQARRSSWEEKQTKRYKEPVSAAVRNQTQLPPEWTWVSLDELVAGEPRSLQSGPFGSSLKHSEFTSEGVLVVGIDNVQAGSFSMGSENRISPAKFETLKKYQARAGDLLITVMASLGRTCVVPANLERAIITKHVYRITMNLKLVLPEFYNLALQAPTPGRKSMLQGAQGQTRPGLNGAILKEIPLPLCSLAEQREVVERITEALSNSDKLAAEIGAQMRRTQALRQSILNRAFSGMLVDQRPEDEPAQRLLERITDDNNQLENQKKNGRRRAA